MVSYSGVFTDGTGFLASGTTFDGQLTLEGASGEQYDFIYPGIGWRAEASAITISYHLPAGDRLQRVGGELQWDFGANQLAFFTSGSTAGSGQYNVAVPDWTGDESSRALPTAADLAGRTASLTFFSPLGAGHARLIFASVAAVPEPASWALMIGGLGFAGGMIRRQRASKLTYA